MNKERFILKIDIVCKTCGYRNKTTAVLADEFNVVACGDCGELLSVPKDMNQEEQKAIKLIIDFAMKEVNK